jgi:hypothetical protein
MMLNNCFSNVEKSIVKKDFFNYTNFRLRVKRIFPRRKTIIFIINIISRRLCLKIIVAFLYTFFKQGVNLFIYNIFTEKNFLDFFNRVFFLNAIKLEFSRP